MTGDKTISVRDALAAPEPRDSVVVRGWVRTRRDSKAFSFLELNDGSCLKNLQVVVDADSAGYAVVPEITTGASIEVHGALVESQGKGQRWEVQAGEIFLIGPAEADYPLQKKGHSLEYLREIAHLRPRSNLFGAMFRVRSRLAFAVHAFFQERAFVNIHAPIITASDCEGAGDLFRVTALDPDGFKRGGDGGVDWSQDFFHRPTYLTVSGQLQAEIFATAFTNVYTFGPTFRAENSNTSRHAAEFWMIEPEMAFCDLAGDMSLAEEMIQSLVATALDACADDLELFARFVDKNLMSRLEFVRDRRFQRVSYSDAIRILKDSGRDFEYSVEWGMNLQAEHERFLTEEHFRCPVTVHDYPRAIKPFYMRRNDDGETVGAMDLLVPGIGEIVGGSQREERLDRLDEALAEQGLSGEEYWWYRDLRRYGTVPHSGFGLGFERFLMFVTGMKNIRDVVPFPRTPGNADF